MLPVSDYDFFIEPQLFARSPVDANVLDDWGETHSIDTYKELFTGLRGSVGQKDADLLWWKPAHQRLATALPETKFLFILRDPVKRAESQYFNELGKGREALTFEQALEREAQDVLTPWQQLHLQYKKRGCYAESLEHFFSHIPKERVLVVILEELFANWNTAMIQVCEFLGINSEEGIAIKPLHSNKEELLERKAFSKNLGLVWAFDFWDRMSEAIVVRTSKETNKRQKMRKHLRGWYYESKRKGQQLNPDIVENLKSFYKPHNEKLERLLNKKLIYW